MTEGQRVIIAAGDRAGTAGTVAAVFRERGCGCRSVIVRLDGGREWVGKVSEVRPA